MLIDVIKESKIRVVEVHVTNPNMRGGPSTCGGSANCLVYGFGIHGYVRTGLHPPQRLAHTHHTHTG